MQTILVIEDESDLRENLLDFLIEEGFEAIGAEDGYLGVQLARKLLPDLIICDVLMPKLNGHGVLTALHQDPVTALIPFVFLTAKGTVEDFRTGLRLGADDYLLKPYRQEELLTAISTRLAKQSAIQQLQRATVQQLQQQIEDLQQSNLLKDDFLSIASHELRSPMTNIKMAIQLLQKAPRDEQQQRYLNLLQEECTREIELLNDLLDVQRLDANADPLRLEVIQLQELIATITQSFEAHIQERQQILKAEVASDLLPFISDVSDLQRIVTELLNNACKYTAPGGRVCLSVQGQNPVQIVVSNEAEIPAKDLPHLFERFYRVQSCDRWKRGGTGLGLALVKKLVERLKGDIQVTSSEGWTRFCVQLPALTELA